MNCGGQHERRKQVIRKKMKKIYQGLHAVIQYGWDRLLLPPPLLPRQIQTIAMMSQEMKRKATEVNK